MKILFVVNPVSGGDDHGETIETMKEMAAERGFETFVLKTAGAGDKENLKTTMSSFNPDRVIAGGGDGTIRLVAEVIACTQVTMGIVPMGSANGLATALGIPQDPILALERILQSTEVLRMDMLRFNEKHLCVHLADIGVNALLVQKYHDAGDRGMFGYAKNLLAAIQESEAINIKVKTPDQEVVKTGFMMAFANAPKYGTGVVISEGSVSDGKFEICNVERLALDAALKAGLTILNVFIDRNMFSDVISCTSAEIETDREVHFQIDGEYMGKIKHLKIDILPASINLLV